jgi:hypothetical protein
MDPQAILSENGMTGRLEEIARDFWVFRGEIGIYGVSVEIDGKPDEAFLRQAAEQMRAVLDAGP